MHAADFRREEVGSATRTGLIVLGGAVLMFVVWVASDAILLIFAGLLVGVLLDACVRGLRTILPFTRGWLLAIAGGTLASIAVILVLWGTLVLAEEIQNLRTVLEKQVEAVTRWATQVGLSVDQDGRSSQDFGSWIMSHAGSAIGPATTALSTLVSGLVNAAIVVIIGAFTAANPAYYRDAVVRLLPLGWRARVAGTLDEVGSALRWWLLGQLAAMVLIAVTVALALWLLAVPGALLLGLQAGIFAFIPYFGPLIAGVPIALSALPMGLALLALTIFVYSVIQVVEGYWLTPLIQERAVDLPPLLTIAGLLLMGALFGMGGIILATPLIAAGRVLVLRLYIEGYLEQVGEASGTGAPPP